MEAVFGSKFFRLIEGDITKQKTDVIVNAANSSLIGGGGVDGAIHRAGGPDILEECKRIVKESGRCSAGQAVITTGGMLAAKFVIHTVGPVWHGGNKNECKLLADCYRNSLILADKHKCQNIAFPSISTGVYRFPIERAANIAVETIIDSIKDLKIREVTMVLFSKKDFNVYLTALKRKYHS